MRIRNYLVFFAALAAVPATGAQALKKVLILDFANIEKNSDYQYLETSITDAVTELLKKQFAFQQLEKTSIESTASANYLYPDDFYTKSAAMNLGLLTRQDIVICGGYRIVKKRAPVIQTQVRILDLQKKSVAAEFTVEGPADANMFQSIEKLANRVADEARAVLPNKDDWQKQGLSTKAETVFFENFTIGARAGGVYMHSGWNEYFKPDQPAFSVLLKANMPFIWSRLGLEANFTYFKHGLKEGAATTAQALGLAGVTTNYMPGGRIFFDAISGQKFQLTLGVGGGYAMQTTSVTGQYSSSFTNGLPFASAGFDIGYAISRQFSVVLSISSIMQIEKSIYSFVHIAGLGVNYRL